MRCVGVDPDLHTLSVAELNEDGSLKGVHVVKATGLKGLPAAVAIIRELQKKAFMLKTTGTTAGDFVLAVEGQDVGYTGRTNMANPQDLIPLAAVAGGVVATLRAHRTYLIKPSQWKGSVPKKIHQRRILSKLGIEYRMMGGNSPYPVPVDFERFVLSGKANAGDWKDINDSVGLAVYARNRYKKEEKGGR